MTKVRHILTVADVYVAVEPLWLRLNKFLIFSILMVKCSTQLLYCGFVRRSPLSLWFAFLKGTKVRARRQAGEKVRQCNEGDKRRVREMVQRQGQQQGHTMKMRRCRE